MSMWGTEPSGLLSHLAASHSKQSGPMGTGHRIHSLPPLSAQFTPPMSLKDISLKTQQFN
eukprot:2697155-Amphidinium_carterae.1